VPGSYSDLRYHSLVVLPDSVPDELEVTESIATVEGKRLLANFPGAPVPSAVGR
jgi:hypothetical protein